MRTKKLVSISALVFAICISTQQAVKAGGPPPISVASTASVKGVARFEGTAPKPKPISMAADPSCAKQHPSPVFSQEVMTDSKGELENVIVFVSEGLGDRTFDPPSQPIVINHKGCMYEPHLLAIRANPRLTA